MRTTPFERESRSTACRRIRWSRLRPWDRLAPGAASRGLLLAVLAAPLLFGNGKPARAAGEAGLPALRVPDALGVNIHFTSAPDSELEQLAAAGFRFVRMDYDWNNIEPTPGHYNFSVYDSFVRLMRRYGIRPLLILDYSNKNYDAGLSPHDEAGWDAYARFAAASVRHFRHEGVIWEIWNEPNGFWVPRPNVDAYANMAVRAAAAMRKADHDATILAPGSSGIDLGFIETCFKHGLLSNITAVSVHPYRGGGPETVTGEYARLRSLIRQYAPGHRLLPIVSSEWGYTSTTVTDLQQAQYLAREWLTNLADGIRLSIWYDWHNDGTDPKNGEHNFGTVTSDYQPKLSYLSARTLTHTLGGFEPVRSIPLQAGDFAVLFRKGNELKLAAWTTAGPHLLNWASPAPANVVSMTGEASVLRPEDGSLALMLSGSPQYVDVTASPRAQIQASMSISPAEVTAPSGIPTPIKVTFHNTSAQPIQGQLTLTAPGSAAPGAAIPVDAAPGVTTTITVTGIRRNDRSAAPQEWNLRFSGEGVDLVEPVEVNVSDPFVIDLTPLGGGAGLEILNPAGTPFQGTAETSTGGGTPVVVPLSLAKGVTHEVAPLGIRFPDSDVPIAVTVRSAAGHAIVSQFDSRYEWAPGFGPRDDLAGRYAAVLDGNPAVPARAALDLESVPPPGAPRPAMGLKYNFGSGWRFVRVAPQHSKDTPITGKPKALRMWLYSDGSGNVVRCRFTDSTGQTFQPTARLPMSTPGWQWITMPMIGGGMGTWGGAGDGVIHYPVHWDSLFLVDNTGAAGDHETWISSPMLEYPASP